MPAAKRYLPDLMTATEIADLLGRTRSWWSQLVSAGVVTPVDRAGPRGAARYRLADAVVIGRERDCDMTAVEPRIPPSVLAAIAGGDDTDAPDGAPDLQAERALHERRKRELTEIKLAAARAELLPADIVRRVYGDVGAATREHVMALEVEAATELDEHGLAWLQGALRRALQQASDDAERLSAPLYAAAAGDEDEDA
jgi:hypothetical protein